MLSTLMTEKQAALLSLMSAPVMLSWGEVKQDFSSVRIVVWFQRQNRKLKSHHW
jgi:hypothetical protein